MNGKRARMADRSYSFFLEKNHESLSALLRDLCRLITALLELRRALESSNERSICLLGTGRLRRAGRNSHASSFVNRATQSHYRRRAGAAIESCLSRMDRYKVTPGSLSTRARLFFCLAVLF
jgi:hypothetical protein